MAKEEEEKKKKSILDKAIDMFTDRDEKEAAAEAAKKELEAKLRAEADARQVEIAKKKAAAEKAAADKAAAEKAAAEKAAAEKAAAEKAAAVKATAEKAAAEKAAKLRADAEAKLQEIQKQNDRIAAQKQAEAQAEAAKPKYIADYTLVAGDTLSAVALKFYKNATRDYWMVIYEANKEAIGDNPGMVHAGTVLHIPELPESLKKK